MESLDKYILTISKDFNASEVIDFVEKQYKNVEVKHLKSLIVIATSDKDLAYTILVSIIEDIIEKDQKEINWLLDEHGKGIKPPKRTLINSKKHFMLKPSIFTKEETEEIKKDLEKTKT
jgi:hypothetical protein